MKLHAITYDLKANELRTSNTSCYCDNCMNSSLCAKWTAKPAANKSGKAKQNDEGKQTNVRSELRPSGKEAVTTKQKKSSKGKQIVGRPVKKGKSSENGSKNWYCIVCDESRVENMIQCTRCMFWVHELCADEIKPNYRCDFCA